MRFRYATLLTVVRYDDHTHIEIHSPWKAGRLLRQYDIAQPVRRAVVSTTAHCQLLCWLGAERSIAGVCDARYIQTPQVAMGIRRGSVADCGNSMAPATERIAEIGADAIIVSPFEQSGGYGQLEQLGIPIIEAADYMEPSPLARAEWMRLYGIIFGCERQADSLFHVLDSTYTALKKLAIKQPEGRCIVTERKTGSVWYCPGGRSTVGTLIGDAHGRYPWADDRHSGSLTLSPEEVIDHASHADVWMMTYAGQPPTRRSLADEYHGYTLLGAFAHGEIYGCDTERTHYFEEVPFRPDYLLRDYIQIAHPGLNLGGLRYYHRIE